MLIANRWRRTLVGALLVMVMGGGLTACFNDTPNPVEDSTAHEHDDDPPEQDDTAHEHDDDEDDDRTQGTGRLLVADATGGRLRLLDLRTAQTIHTFTVVGTEISLYTTESGRIGAVVQADVHRVNFIDSGLEVEPHDDHTHDLEHEPQLLSVTLDGIALGARRPVHFVSHHGHITQHFDGVFAPNDPTSNVLARNYILAEAALLEAQPEPLVLTATSHHGAAVPTETGHIIFTDPDPDRAFGSLPSGFLVLDESGATLQTFNDKLDTNASCLGMHGEAVVGHHYIFGCDLASTGFLILTEDPATGTFSARKLPYPDARRSSTLAAHPAQPFAVAQYGSFPNAALIRVDPEATALTLNDIVGLPANQCGIHFEREHGERLVVLVEDGSLHVFTPNPWATLVALNMTAPFQCFGAVPAPRLAVSEGFAYVSRPAQGQVVEINLETLAVTRTLDVGGTPSAVAVFGWWGVLSGAHEHD